MRAGDWVKDLTVEGWYYLILDIGPGQAAVKSYRLDGYELVEKLPAQMIVLPKPHQWRLTTDEERDRLAMVVF